MKKLRRIIPILLVVCFLIPTIPNAMAKGGVKQAIEKEYDSLIGKQIPYEYQFNNKALAWGCHGFVNYAWYNIFGYDTFSSKCRKTAMTSGLDTIDTYLQKNARPGDILRFDGIHSVLLIDITATGVTIFDTVGSKTDNSLKKRTLTYKELVTKVNSKIISTTKYFLYKIDDTIWTKLDNSVNVTASSTPKVTPTPSPKATPLQVSTSPNVAVATPKPTKTPTAAPPKITVTPIQISTSPNVVSTSNFIYPVAKQKTVPTGCIGIYTANDMKNIKNFMGRYILMNNIDMSALGNWKPIGDGYNNSFRGIFDGNGYEIRNLKISEDAGYPSGGLFGYTSSEAIIKNLALVKANITVKGMNVFAGSLIGNCSGSNVYNCYSIGSNISASTPGGWNPRAQAGGLIGYVDVNSKIEGLYSNSNVYSLCSSDIGISRAGGIAGHIASAMKNCHNDGEVFADLTKYNSVSSAGGIAGSTSVGFTIERCSNNGTITAKASSESGYFDSISYAGGIIGQNNVSIIDCYNSGSVTAVTIASKENIKAVAGGLIGYTTTEIIIQNSYNLGVVSSIANSTKENANGLVECTGGLIGYDNCLNSKTKLTQSYYVDLELSPVGTGDGVYDDARRLSKEQMKKQASFAGFDFNNIWVMGTGNYPYPILRFTPSNEVN